MNSIETNIINEWFVNPDGKTMEDYFTELNISLDIDKNTLKNACKENIQMKQTGAFNA